MRTIILGAALAALAFPAAAAPLNRPGETPCSVWTLSIELGQTRPSAADLFRELSVYAADRMRGYGRDHGNAALANMPDADLGPALIRECKADPSQTLDRAIVYAERAYEKAHPNAAR